MAYQWLGGFGDAGNSGAGPCTRAPNTVPGGWEAGEPARGVGLVVCRGLEAV